MSFVGSRAEKEKDRWVPLEDIKEGHFIFIRPNEDFKERVGKGKFWVARALGLVDPNHLVDQVSHDDISHRVPMFPMEWWRPKDTKADADDKK